jgi:putative endonuclease
MASHTFARHVKRLLAKAKYALRSSASAERRRALSLNHSAALSSLTVRSLVAFLFRLLSPPRVPETDSYEGPIYTTKRYCVSLFAVDDSENKAPSNPPSLHFVYIIVSVSHPERYYVGLTNNVRRRLSHHNQGIVRSTASHRPWRLRTAICFVKRRRASEFEYYLKTGSGIAFLRKRFL